MVTSLGASHAHGAAVTAATLQQALADSRLHRGLLDTGKSGSVSCGVTAPFSWVLVHRFCLCPPRVCFPSPVDVLVAPWWVKGDLQEGLCHT